MNPVRTLLGSLAGLAHARLGLLAMEGREELARFAYLVLGGFTAIFLTILALAVASAAVIIAAGDAYRLLAASILAALFTAGAAYAVIRMKAELAVKPAAFGASLGELEVDRAALLVTSRESRSALIENGEELVRLVQIGMAAYAIGRRLSRSLK